MNSPAIVEEECTGATAMDGFEHNDDVGAPKRLVCQMLEMDWWHGMLTNCEELMREKFLLC